MCVIISYRIEAHSIRIIFIEITLRLRVYFSVLLKTGIQTKRPEIQSSVFTQLMTDDFRASKFAKMTNEKVNLLPTVECVRLTDIIGRFGIHNVDLFSLDVEGTELSLLKAIDFDMFSASAILVEVQPNSPSVKPLLSSAGYVQDENIGHNNVFLHPDFKKSITDLPGSD